jgi:hypothetical protein
MANLFSVSEIAQYEQAFNDIHDSFAREVVMIKEPKRIVVEEIDENYNYFYGGSQPGSVKETEVPISGVFKVRIMWNDPSKEFNSSVDGMDSVRPKIHGNTCRIKMKKDAYDFVTDSRKFLIDGRACEWVGFSRPHGIVNNINFYTVLLREVNENG